MEPVEKSTERVVTCVTNRSDVSVPPTVISPTTLRLSDTTNEPVIAKLPLILPSVNVVVALPKFKVLAVNVSNVTSAEVPTSCPIDIVWDSGDEPSKLCPLLDNVTPVPCSNVNGLVIEILNTSFVASPNSVAFDDKSWTSPLSFIIDLSVLSLIINFLGVKNFCVVETLLNFSGNMYPYRFTLKVVLINRSPSTWLASEKLSIWVLNFILPGSPQYAPSE